MSIRTNGAYDHAGTTCSTTYTKRIAEFLSAFGARLLCRTGAVCNHHACCRSRHCCDGSGLAFCCDSPSQHGYDTSRCSRTAALRGILPYCFVNLPHSCNNAFCRCRSPTGLRRHFRTDLGAMLGRRRPFASGSLRLAIAAGTHGRHTRLVSLSRKGGEPLAGRHASRQSSAVPVCLLSGSRALQNVVFTGRSAATIGPCGEVRDRR